LYRIDDDHDDGNNVFVVPNATVHPSFTCHINDKRWSIFTCAEKLAYSELNLPQGTKQKRLMKLKIKTQMLRRNGSVIKPWRQSWGRNGVYGGKDLRKR